MKYCPATGGKSPRSLIRQGQCITLEELCVLGGTQMLLLGPVSNIHVLGYLHPQDRVGLGGGRLLVERQEEPALRDRQVWFGLVSLGRCTSALLEPSPWRGIVQPFLATPAVTLRERFLAHEFF